ncbi:hypothetical protein SAMN05444162_3213 [Paenibacillaceae bacterium GAS479]|nr:hypothetical protein SAMN05444162_3213 [Paenibacillaceae bacterium GAS479]
MKYAVQSLTNPVNGCNIGMILVLFILLLIVSSLFINNGFNPELSITDSRRFTLINQSNFNLLQSETSGRFEPPGPPRGNVIFPYSSYYYEVLYAPGITNTAYANYVVRTGNISRGYIDTRLENGRVGTSSGWSVTRLGSAVITYSINERILTITNAP